MLKNKFKLIFILTLIVLIIIMPFSKAVNEATTEEATMTSEDTSEQPIIPSENENQQNALIQEGVQQDSNTESQQAEPDNLKSSDVYLTGDNINIDYLIDGNLYIMANSVTISSQVGGDAFILARDVTITNQAYIYGNLFNISERLNVEGTVYDIYSLSQSVTISGFVYRDVKISSGTVKIPGTIRRNAFINAETLSFKDEESSLESENLAEGIISGNLTYFSPKEANISKENVLGNTDFHKTTEDTTTVSIQTYLISLGTSLITIIGIWLLLLWLAPKFSNNAQSLLLKKPLPLIGFGFLGLLLIPIISIVLLLVGLSSVLSIIILATYFILLMISSTIFVIAINNAICEKLKIDKTFIKLGILVICGAVFWAIKLIPLVGGIVSFVSLILGIGLILYSTLKNKNTDASKNLES